MKAPRSVRTAGSLLCSSLFCSDVCGCSNVERVGDLTRTEAHGPQLRAENNVRHENSTKKYHRGVYTLIIRSRRPCKVSIRRHASVVVKRGWYLYTGSALGRGSASLEARIRRHLARDKHEFWHIDRILSCESAQVVAVVFAETTSDAECTVNAALLEHQNTRVFFRGIGSSDCRCESHFLAADGSLSPLKQIVRSCYTKLGLRPHVLRDLKFGESDRILVPCDAEPRRYRRTDSNAPVKASSMDIKTTCFKVVPSDKCRLMASTMVCAAT